MSTKEKLQVHREMKEQNQKNVNRWKAKEMYRNFCRSGQFQEGRRVLELLKYGSVTLWLDDVDWNVQTACEDAGFYVWFSRNGNRARAYI